MKIFASFLLFFGLLAIICTATSGTTCEATESQLENINLIFYSSESSKNSTSVKVADAAELMDVIDDSKPSVIYIHGWTENPDSDSVETVRGAYMDLGNVNIIVANYSEIAATDYSIASACVNAVGLKVALGIDSMVDAGLDYSKLTLVGHSLGGQVAGAIGRNSNFTVPKVVALDPAGPNFLASIDADCLSSTDATWVLSIHTDAGMLGASDDDGTANFYPNGGSSAQPGCANNNTILQNACCHYRSWKYFAESVINENAFIGIKCDSWAEFEAGECSSNDTAIMGYATPLNASGKYYLQTASSSPFGLGYAGTTYVS